MVSDDDQDLYCLDCGYSLRGLVGDPLRCPECGHDNPSADLKVPARIIERELRRLESGPAACASSLVALGGWLLPMTLFLARAPANQSLRSLWWFVLALIAAAVAAWVAGVVMFRSSCRGRIGWGGALLAFHVYGVLIAGLGVVLFIILIQVAIGVPLRMPLGSYLYWLWRLVPGMTLKALGVPLLLLAYVSVARWLYQRAKARIAPLLRMTAAARAREYVSQV